MFTFREILNLAKEFGRSLPGKHLIPRYFNIDRYERQKYGLISMCILSFDTSTSHREAALTIHWVQNLPKITLSLTALEINDVSKIQDDLINGENLKVANAQLCNELQVCNFTMIQQTLK